MLFFIFLLVFFLSLVRILINNVLVWWSIFLLMTLLFVILNKSIISYSGLFNYFVLQESLGLVFLLFSFGWMQLFIILFKVGVAPLHFWIFNVMNSVFGFNLMWFLTFQKLPFLLVLLQFILRNIIFVLVLGLLMCIIQMLLTKSYKNLLILSSTESFNWVLMGFIISFFNVFLIFLYYFFIMLYLIPKYELIRFKGFLGWETMLVFINLPFRVRFFVKIFALTEMLKIYDLVVLLLLFMIFLSVLSLSFWLVNLSVKNLIDYKYRKSLYFFVLPIMMLVLL